jgi:putative transposase
VATAVREWLEQRRISTHYIDPGSPWQNAYNESFNGIFRTTCLNRWAFASVSEAQAVICQGLDEYNTIRPHGSLTRRSPAQFTQALVGDVQTTTMKHKSLT